jgi:hypothetical protein
LLESLDTSLESLEEGVIGSHEYQMDCEAVGEIEYGSNHAAQNTPLPYKYLGLTIIISPSVSLSICDFNRFWRMCWELLGRCNTD